MQKHKRFLLPLFALFPLLLANAPSPWPQPNHYEDFTFTAITLTEVEEYYVYATTITNTGTGFIDARLSYLQNHPFHGQIDSQASPIIVPGASYHYVVYSKTLTSVEGLTLRVAAYDAEIVTEITAFTITNKTKTTYERMHDENVVQYYLYEFSTEVNYPDDAYYYTMITAFTYEDDAYAYMDENLNNNYPKFYTEENFDLNLIEITNIYVVKGRSRGGGYGEFLSLIGRFILLAFGIQFIVIPGLVIGLIFVIRAHKKKRRLRLEQKEENNSSD